jgi:hypothetical protein
MLKNCIQDLRTIQDRYPERSRGFESLRLAILILERSVEIEEEVNPAWVAGEPAASITINAAPGEATFHVEYQ